MTGQIFISYRREDSGYAAGRLFDRLCQRFGKAGVFMDIDTIGLGVDFAHTIDAAIGACDAVLAIIGRDWLVAGAQGKPRLDDPADFVRQEIAAALARDIPVIPVFVNGATMPSTADLPDALAGLVLRNGLAIRHERFDADARQLIEGLEKILRQRSAGDRLQSHEDTSAAPSPSKEVDQPSPEAAVLNVGEEVVLVRQEGIAKRFWTRVHRAELVLTTQRLIFSDLEDQAYSFEISLADLKGAVFSYSAAVSEGTIKTVSDGKFAIGIRDEELFVALTAAIREQVNRNR